ncbi:hypothetical protein OHR68_03040 [Spirillospora sp. NBC_00431]
MAHGQLFQASVGIRAGLILIEDPASSDLHEDWEPGESFVDAADASIYLSVQPSVDGPVNVSVHDGLNSISGMQLYYEGEIILESNSCLIYDADEHLSFSVPCPSGSARLRILADEPGLAGNIAILFLSR